MRWVSIAPWVAACGQGVGSNDWDDPLPGTVVLLETDAVTLPATIGDVGYPTPVLTDAVVDGGTISVVASVVISGASGASPIVFQSDDEGDNWTRTDLPPPDVLSLGELYGLHVVDGQVVLAASSGEERGGQFYEITKLIGVDVDAATYTTDPNDTTRHVLGRPHAAGGFIVGVQDSSSDDAVNLFSYDVAAGVPSSHDVALDGYLCGWLSDDGSTGSGWCAADPITGGICRRSADLAGATQTVDAYCVHDAWLPHEFADQDGEIVTARGILGLSEAGGRVAAYEPDPAGLRIFDLGPGEGVFERPYLHPAFGTFIPLKGSLRLVEVAADGSVSEIEVPASPCADDTRCGVESTLVRLIPLGGDRYGAVWLVDRGSGGGGGDTDATTTFHRHRILYYRVVEVERVAVPQELPAFTAPMLRYPGAIEATDLEKACASAFMCWGELDRTIESPPEIASPLACVQHWSRRRVAPGEADPALDRFLAAPLGDCSAVQTAWPVLGLYGRTGCRELTCAGDVAVRGCETVGVNTVVYSELVDCAETGMVCRSWGGGGSGGNCVVPTHTGPDMPDCNSCDGDVATLCMPYANGVRTSLDCADMDATCDAGLCVPACASGDECVDGEVVHCEASDWASNFERVRPVSCEATAGTCQGAECVGTAVSEPCVATGTNPLAPCAGDYRLACANDQIHWQDCAEMGATCTAGLGLCQRPPAP
jgi:hypothetical protein